MYLNILKVFYTNNFFKNPFNSTSVQAKKKKKTTVDVVFLNSHGIF